MQVVFLGLDMVIPLMTAELLQFPKLARAFFSLLSYAMEVYPERIAALPGMPCLWLCTCSISAICCHSRGTCCISHALIHRVMQRLLLNLWRL